MYKYSGETMIVADRHTELKNVIKKLKQGRFAIEFYERALLKTGREHLGLSMRKSAKMLDITHAQIGRVERNEPCGNEEYVINGMYCILAEHFDIHDIEVQEFLHALQGVTYELDKQERLIDQMLADTMATCRGNSVDEMLDNVEMLEELAPYLRMIRNEKNKAQVVNDRIKRFIARMYFPEKLDFTSLVEKAA